MMPQFKGKIFILENYSIEISRYLVSGVDVWLNNPRRPMEGYGKQKTLYGIRPQGKGIMVGRRV